MISAILFILSVVCYSLSQASIFDRPNQGDNKYKEPRQLAPRTWYYRLTKVRYRERFPLSATAMVFLTDHYHFYQFFFKLFLAMAIGFYNVWWHGVAAWAAFGIVFTVTYRIARK